MLHNPLLLAENDRPLHLELRAESAERDVDGGFPSAGFAALEARGLTTPSLKPDGFRHLLRLLAEVGRGDLPVGRIFEGHVNVLALLERHSPAAQSSHYQDLARKGHLFGIWNTDHPEHPLKLVNGRLVGRKTYASGIDGLSHAIVTAHVPQGRLMIVVPLEDLPVDRSWWQPMGMRASGSHIVDFTGMEVQDDMILGAPDAYLERPWFAAGAIRFVAVHVGGMHAVLDIVLEHLRKTRRIEAPYQLQRIARMGAAVESGYGWLDRAAAEWSAVAAGSHPAAGLIATVNAARGFVEAAAMSVLEDGEKSVGAAGMIAPHPLERIIRDLRTYLRQPDPDGAQAALGSALAAGDWHPGACYQQPRT
ncbi:acyl-CoA dehydrogenase [Aureimonas fodinaquatilis]|uniref:Acyl-CoA dehydrogenase n=1 Tax=Aureimonas fodinaquatilis TaxID=2565783 RepID=A0A5B0DWI0_9HYPH|nr:acyl-CoA dehydrogenase family protein [Aureimonas fodinaquatilis]KAA0970718.1 acyl-CoA dehydrogenase [Aureimonas fodinaquatilis]